MKPRGAAPLFTVKAADDGTPKTLELDQDPLVEGALMAIDPKSGEIRAMVGGYDFNRSKFNRATQALRQVGSTMKAYVYGAAFTAGKTPATLVQDVPTRFIRVVRYEYHFTDAATRARTGQWWRRAPLDIYVERVSLR